MKHKHAELIKAWADGAEIEIFSNRPEHSQVQVQGYFPKWVCDANPNWLPSNEYRIKPDGEPRMRDMYIYKNAVMGTCWIDEKIPAEAEMGTAWVYVGRIGVFK